MLLSASDVLSDLVAMSRSGEAVPPDLGSECRAALEQSAEQDGEGGEMTTRSRRRPISRESISRRSDLTSATNSDAAAEQTYAIVFRPKPEMLKKANEPLYILRELRKLGELDLVRIGPAAIAGGT